MRIRYLDEPETPELHGGTSHFVLIGLSIINRRFGLEHDEIHTGRWLGV